MMVVVTKVLKGPNISLGGVLKPVLEGRATVEQVVGLGSKSLGDEPYGESVRACLQLQYLNNDESAQGPSADVDGDADLDDDDDFDDDDEGFDDDELDDDDDPDDDDEVIDEFLMKFKTALHDIYEHESAENIDDEEGLPVGDSVDRELDARLRVTAGFERLRAAIPSMEEARNIARRLEASRNPAKIHRPSMTSRSPIAPAAAGSGLGGGAGGSTGGSGSSVAEAAAETVDLKQLDSTGRLPPRSDGVSEVRVDLTQGPAVPVEAGDIIDAAEISFDTFSDNTYQVCAALATVEKSDQIVWTLFLDPGAPVPDLASFARTLSREETGTDKAYRAVKMAAQYLSLKNLLTVSERVLNKNRSFSVEVTVLLNNVSKSIKALTPDNRQLASLDKALDHAGAALVRMEALRTNYNFAHHHKEDYDREAVTVYYEEAIRQITDLTGRDLLAQARKQADSDTVSLLASFVAEQFVEAVKGTCREYVKHLVEEEYTKSSAVLELELEDHPISFEGAPRDADKLIPVELIMPGGLGASFDTVCTHVCTEVWMVTESIHKPEKAIPEIIDILRQVMVTTMTFQPERKRHQEQPSMAFSVVSLDKLSGNANLKELYIRVRDDGQIYYVENFEDGSFVDLFDLREYKPARMATAAKKKAESEETETLQTGRKYLYTLGRTSYLFGETPAEVIDSCIRGDSGAPRLFPTF